MNAYAQQNYHRFLHILDKELGCIYIFRSDGVQIKYSIDIFLVKVVLQVTVNNAC